MGGREGVGVGERVVNRRKARENLWQRCTYPSIYLYYQHSTAFISSVLYKVLPSQTSALASIMDIRICIHIQVWIPL